MKTENLPPAEIKVFQELRMMESLLYLRENSPFYRDLFNRNKIDLQQIKKLEDLVRIPTTTKEDFSNRNLDFLCVPRERIVDYTSTSGTTGSPVTVVLTENDLLRLAYNEECSFICANGKSTDVYQLMLTLDRQFMAGMAYYLGIRRLGAGAVRVGPVSPKIQWENILRYKPNALVVVPSFLLKLSAFAKDNGIDLNTCGVEKAVCIGESIRNADLTPNNLALRIKENWSIHLFSTYASTEMQTAFTECEHGSGGHHNPELIILELLDDDGNPVKEGEPGEVTITSLGVEGMPLLRYRTGDICILFHESCPCGRNTTRLSPVLGRKNQMIKFKGTTLFPPAIYDALSKVHEISDYLVEISKNDLETDEIHIHITLASGTDNADEKIKGALQSKLRVTPALRFITAEELQAMRPADSRKPVMILFR